MNKLLFEAYCVKCKVKTSTEGVMKTSDSGRRMLMGKCHCGTKVNLVVDKNWGTEDEALWDE